MVGDKNDVLRDIVGDITNSSTRNANPFNRFLVGVKFMLKLLAFSRIEIPLH